MKKHINKKSIIIASIMLLLLVTIGTSLAYIFTKTEPVENTFKPSRISCAVIENGTEAEYTNNIVKTGATKKEVKIKNTGDTDAYIRVAVVVNWASADGSGVWAQKPADSDYEITYNSNEDWFYGGDGFYYYSKAVPPGESTSVLIDEARQLSSAPNGTDGTQYYLSIEVIASAIQASPENVVEDQWGVAVMNGVITPKDN